MNLPVAVMRILMYRVSQKSTSLFEASYVQNYNTDVKFETYLERNKNSKKSFWYQIYRYSFFQWEITCKRNHIYTTTLSYWVCTLTLMFQLRDRSIVLEIGGLKKYHTLLSPPVYTVGISFAKFILLINKMPHINLTIDKDLKVYANYLVLMRTTFHKLSKYILYFTSLNLLMKFRMQTSH